MGHSTAAEKSRLETAHPDLLVDAARNVTTMRLADSMLHDVRNPLNALSINLDVLTERMRRELGEIPSAQEKNFRVMREQIHRIDAIMREYLEFIAPRPEADPGWVDLSDVTLRAVKVLGHECRRSMVRLRQLVEPDLRVAPALGDVRFAAMQILFRAIVRAGQEGEVEVTLQRDGAYAVLRVRDSLADPSEPFAYAVPALERLCASLGGEVRRTGPEFVLSIPLMQEG